MVDAIGLPTIFFTHSAADLQWPELARLISPDDNSSSSRTRAVIENPAIADCSSMLFMLVCWGLLTTGCVLSGNIVAVLTFMASPGCLMLQTWRSCYHATHQGGSYQVCRPHCIHLQSGSCTRWKQCRRCATSQDQSACLQSSICRHS